MSRLCCSIEESITYATDSPFCCTFTNECTFVNSIREENCRLVRTFFSPQGRKLFSNLSDFNDLDWRTMISPALDARLQVHSIEDRRNGIGKFGFLVLLHYLSCLFLVFLRKCCNMFSSKPTRSMCVSRFFASSPSCCMACRGALFPRFPYSMGSTLCVTFDSRGCFAHSACCSMENYLVSLLPCGSGATNPYCRTFPLETGCYTSTTANVTVYHRLVWMWSFPFRRSVWCIILNAMGLVGSFFPNRRKESSPENNWRN